ncbi:MAG: hypothetical protein KIT33_04500 [Candidatus Kapabacteria bacterium]|nr:hypothetical protein [Ignavibacteriota bacterium]MCW5884217.1 hypothetical protein [Candidatus Kapabacteria bacterium]
MIKFSFVFYILFSLFLINSCADGIVSECPDDSKSNMPATFSAIQTEVFNKSCAYSGCHAGNLPSAGLDLSAGKSYDNIVNKEIFGLMYVKPGSADESYLFDRINSNSSSSVMPPTGRLPQSVIDSVRAWIDAGALNN